MATATGQDWALAVAVGSGRACMLAAIDQRWCEGLVLRAVIDRKNVASLCCFSACGFVRDDEASRGGYAQLVHRAYAGGGRRLRMRSRPRVAQSMSVLGGPKPYLATEQRVEQDDEDAACASPSDERCGSSASRSVVVRMTVAVTRASLES